MAIDTDYSITLGGVQVYDEDTRERFGRNGSEAVRTVVCNWSDRVTLINNTLGSSTIVGGTAVYVAPLQYPDAPWLYLHEIEPEGVGVKSVGANGMVGYELCRMRLIYRPLDFTGGQEVGEENLDFSGQVISYPGNEPSLFWNGDLSSPVDASANPPIHFNTVNFTRVLRSAPALPVSVILSLVDTVNNATFLGAAAGQLRFNGARSHRRFIPGGALNWDIAFGFTFRSQPWNNMFHPSTGTWDPVENKSGSPLYGAGDFTLLGIGS
jgi:hypothetical protein